MTNQKSLDKTKKEFITDIKNIIKDSDGYGLQKYFDIDNEGGCPCFKGRKKIDGNWIKVWGKCWRVSDNMQDLHIYGKADRLFLEEIGKWVKKALDKQKWYNPYTLIIHKLK